MVVEGMGDSSVKFRVYENIYKGNVHECSVAGTFYSSSIFETLYQYNGFLTEV